MDTPLTRFREQGLAQPEQRLALADAARIVVVEVERRLEQLRSAGILTAQGDAQVSRIAHQQQRTHRAQNVTQADYAVLLFRRGILAQRPRLSSSPALRLP